MAKIQKKSKQQFHLIPFFYFPPKDCPSGSHQTIFPQKPTQPNHLCASVKSVGGSSTPEASVYSVKSVGEYPPPEASVYSVQSVGGLAQANLEWVLWKKFGGLRGYGRDAIPTQPQNYLPTEFAEHTETTGGEEKSVCICEIRWRISSARNFCEFREFRGRTCASKLRVGSVEGIRRAAWVWQGCHTLLRKLPQIARMRTD